MAGAINLDELSDEDFLATLTDESIDVELEDTNRSDAGSADAVEDTETNDEDDGPTQETDESTEEGESEEGEENSQEEDSEDDEEDAGSEDSEESDEDNAEESDEDYSSDEDDNEDDSESDEEDDPETKSGTDGGNKDSGEIDYKAQYEAILAEKEKLQSFYDEATSEFIADGRKVKGFSDPKKIIQSQQMAASYSDRMAALKPYRPLMKPLKERGYLDDPEKFNFDMQVADGDIEALKKLLKDKGIDPYELDMDNVNFEQKNYVASDIDVAVDDMFEDAKRIGVDKQLQEAFTRDWDDSSIVDILSNDQYRADLLDHIQSGAYDIVQDKIAEFKRSDVSGTFTGMSKIDQYKTAVRTVAEERAAQAGSVGGNNTQAPNANSNTTAEPAPNGGSSDEAVAIAKAKEAEEYKKRVQKNKKAAEARKKAASVSRVKTGKKKQKKDFDPDKLSDEEFEAMIKGFMHE